MNVDLSRCVESPFVLERAFDLREALRDYPGLVRLDPVRARLRVESVGGEEFAFTGHLDVALSARCDRCVEVFPLQVAADFRLECRPESRRAQGLPGESEMPGGEVNLAYYSGEELEIEPLLIEQVNLALPMRFLCREDCRGLCPDCGANRNQTDCGCDRPGATDPRLEVLRNLLN